MESDTGKMYKAFTRKTCTDMAKNEFSQLHRSVFKAVKT